MWSGFMYRVRPVLFSVMVILLASCAKQSDRRFVFTEAKIERAKQNIEQHSWAASFYDSLKQVAHEAIRLDSLEICSWISDYTPTRVVDCPHCHTSWKEYIWQWEVSSPDAITCRVCSTRITDQNYPDNDTVRVIDPQGFSHPVPVHLDATGKEYRLRSRIAYEKLFHRVRHWLNALACVYAIERDDKAADAAIRLLTRVGQVYPGYALHDWYHYGTKPWKLAGKISGWNYQDAIFIVAAGKAYDAVRDYHGWTDGKRQVVLEGVFHTALDMLTAIEPAKQIINDTPFRYAGVAVCARILDDPAAMRWVLNPETGVVNFIRRYWFPDGTWCERSPSYHKMALRNFHQLVEVLENYSDPARYQDEDRVEHFYLQNIPRLRPIYEQLFRITYPDGTLPPINDSHVYDRPRALFADAAYAWYDSEFALLSLAAALKDSSLNTGDMFALFYRPPQASQTLRKILQADSYNRPSENIEDMGLVILRSKAKTPETMVTAQYGGIYGGHDHFDKADITLFAHGQEMLSDLGYVYSSFPDIFTWMQRSLAHNTVTIDAINHRYSAGECQLFHTEPGFHVADIRCPWIYHMVTDIYHRQLMLVENSNDACLVDIFRVRGGKQHDWSVHAQSKHLWIKNLNFSAIKRIPGCDYAYTFLKDNSVASITRPFFAEWQWPESPVAGLRMHMLSPVAAEIFRSQAPAQRQRGKEGKTLPWLVVRTQNSGSTTFLAIWEPFKENPVLSTVKLLTLDAGHSDWPAVVQLSWTDGTIDYIASALEDKPERVMSVLNQKLPWQGRFGLVRTTRNRMVKQVWLNAFH